MKTSTACTKFLLLGITFLLLLTGCGVPDITEIAQESLRPYADTYNTLAPPRPSFNFGHANQRFETEEFVTTNALELKKRANGTYYCEFDLKATTDAARTSLSLALSDDYLLASIISVKFDAASNAIAAQAGVKIHPIDSNCEYTYEFMSHDGTYYLPVSRFTRDTGNIEVEFDIDLTSDFLSQSANDFLVSPTQYVLVTYEYINLEDVNGGLVPVKVEDIPVRLFWEKTEMLDVSKHNPIAGYVLMRNWTGTTSQLSDGHYETLLEVDGIPFSESNPNDIVASTGTSAQDTYILSTARNSWKESYTYYLKSVDTDGIYSVWSEPVTVRTEPQLGIPQLRQMTALLENYVSLQINWVYTGFDEEFFHLTLSEGKFGNTAPSTTAAAAEDLVSFYLYLSDTPPTSKEEKALAYPFTHRISEEKDQETSFSSALIVSETSQFSDLVFYAYLPPLGAKGSIDEGLSDAQGYMLYPKFYWVQAVDKWGNLTRCSNIKRTKIGNGYIGNDVAEGTNIHVIYNTDF